MSIFALALISLILISLVLIIIGTKDMRVWVLVKLS